MTGRAFRRPDRPGLPVEGPWQHAIEHFFRLSGAYQEILADAYPQYDEIHRQFQVAFTRTKETITYLAPLEFVAFGVDVMDFGRFRIQRFAEEELDSILNLRAKRVFYPWACVPTKEIVDHWFLRTQEEIEARDPDHFIIEFDPVVRLKYSPHPSPVERALRCLALYDWGSSAWGGPLTPGVPFVISISDSPFSHPSRGPDTGVLIKVPVTDDQTGDELGERPSVVNDLDNRATNNFVKSMNAIVAALEATQALMSSHWKFLDIALGFLVKGWHSKGLSNSSGTQQPSRPAWAKKPVASPNSSANVSRALSVPTPMKRIEYVRTSRRSTNSDRISSTANVNCIVTKRKIGSTLSTYVRPATSLDESSSGPFSTSSTSARQLDRRSPNETRSSRQLTQNGSDKRSRLAESNTSHQTCRDASHGHFTDHYDAGTA